MPIYCPLANQTIVDRNFLHLTLVAVVKICEQDIGAWKPSPFRLDTNRQMDTPKHHLACQLTDLIFSDHVFPSESRLFHT